MKKKKEIYLVPYAHLDSQWRWEFPTTIKKYIKNTIDENIELFNKYENHHFNFTGALRYKMMKEYYENDYKIVKKLIEDDRWHLAGTCLDETDSLVPSVESNIRNILCGYLYQLEEFGKTSKDYMLPDCFGFPANFPTLLKHCGINGFSTQKLTWQSASGIPFEIGIWKGPDGSELISAFNPCNYISRILLPVYLSHGRLSRLNRLGKKNDVWKSFQYYGVGDIGGAPKEYSVRHALKSIEHYEKKDADIIIKQGASDAFFETITKCEKDKMDLYQGDLLLIQHSAGSLTSAAIMKRWNRKNEQMAFVAEAAAVMADLYAGKPYPKEKIKKAWYRVIGNQMHDILPGTCTPTAYEYSQNDEVIALKTWESVIEDSAKAIAPYVEGDGNILLFNPIEDKRNELVDVVLKDADIDREYVMKDTYGNLYPVQLRIENNQIIGCFKPELEPFKWAKYELIEQHVEQNGDLCLIEKDNQYLLKNKYYEITVEKHGKITSIKDRIRNHEILKRPIAYEFQKECPKNFPAWNMDWRDRKKGPFLRLDGDGSVDIIEDGKLRKTLQITIKHNHSVFIKKISLGYQTDLIEFIEHIDWHESGCSLKLALHTDLKHPKATYNWETSRVKREVNRKNQYEVPSRMWVDLSQDDFGISLVEDSKYGYDRPSDDTLRMTLLYTPGIRFLSLFRDQKSQDWGKHTISYGIKTHDGRWHDTDQLARKFNKKVRAFEIYDIKNEQSKEIKLGDISSSQLGFMAIKKAEREDGIIIRLYERYGTDAKAIVTFHHNITEAYVVNGVEEHISKADFNDNQLKVFVKGSGLQSYLVKFKKENISFKEKQANNCLPYNYTLIGSNKEKGTAIFPREITPKKIEDSGIQFMMNIEEKLNAVKTEGQKIKINDDFNTLSLLAASDKGINAIFKWVDDKHQIIKEDVVYIPKITGFIGKWDTRIWKKQPKHYLDNKRDYLWLNECIGITPGYIRRERIAWYSTHTHENGEDLAYKYGYLYHISLDKPVKATGIMLPSETVFITSATTHSPTCKIKSIQYLKDQYDF